MKTPSEKSSFKNIDASKPHIRYRGERTLSLLERIDKNAVNSFDLLTIIDIFYAFYLPYPVLRNHEEMKTESEKARYMFISNLMASSTLDSIRKHTIVDITTSSVASATFLYKLYTSIQKRKPGGRESEQDQIRNFLHEVTQETKRVINKQLIEEALRETLNTTERTKEIEYFVSGLSAGTSSVYASEDTAFHVLKLAENTNVQAILEYLSRIEGFKFPMKKKSYPVSRGEIHGYTVGRDIEEVVPYQYSLPKLLFMVQYVEGSLLLYDKRIFEEPGSLYVLLDKSGSMVGKKILWAKAVALALAKKAVKEHRLFIARFFDSIPYPPVSIGRRVKHGDVIKLLNYIAKTSAVGGTDITRAIIIASEDIKRRLVKGVSDIILITDGEDRIAIEATRRSLLSSKAKLHTVMVQGSNPDLKRISDTYFRVVNLDEKEAIEVIQW